MRISSLAYSTVVVVLASFMGPQILTADSLEFHYTTPTQETAVVQDSAFATVIFSGYITNISAAPITFQLLGGPQPFEPYVASFVSGVPYPGLTLQAGQSTPEIDLAIVTINPFDPDLKYPGFVNIVFPAVVPGIGTTLEQNTLGIEVVRDVAEPATSSALAAGLLLSFLYRISRQIKLPQTVRAFLEAAVNS